jgi:hypothetical protein
VQPIPAVQVAEPLAGDGVDSPTTVVTSSDEEGEAAVPESKRRCINSISSSTSSSSNIPNILLLFSGPKRPDTSLQHFLRQHGMDTDAFDVLDGDDSDLTDDSVWGPIRTAVQAGHYQALVAAPPCGTFSRVRSLPGGPPPLRGVSGTDRYGLRNLTQARTEQLRVHNLLALRTAEVACMIVAQGGALVIEQPAQP